MEIKLVAIDLDGTLLNSEKNISARNIQTIRRVMETGVKVTLCSGRVFSGVRFYGKMVGLRDPMIACNGAMIRDVESGAYLYENLMHVEHCKDIVALLQESDIYFHAYIGDCMVSERMEHSTLRYNILNESIIPEDRIQIEIVPDIGAYIRQSEVPVAKFVVMSDDLEFLHSIRKKVERLDSIEIVSSDRNNFEIMRRGVSKGKALGFLADRMGCSLEQVMAIGDNENDLSMLEVAGYPVVMENGWEQAKKLAKYITKSNNEDGVAYILEKLLL